MKALDDLLDRFVEVGATVEAAGNRLIVRAGPKPIPGELVQCLREAKSEVLAALTPARRPPATAEGFHRRNLNEAAWWRRHFIIRTMDWELGGFRSHPEAERITWCELEDRWHRLNGERLPGWECAGCRAPIGGLPALDLVDGNRTHDNLDCLIGYGKRWRGAATVGLKAMGINPPGDVGDPIG